MPRNPFHATKTFQVRAKLPHYFRIAAVGALGLTVLAVVVGFYRERSNVSFRLRGEHAQLSKEVVAEVNGYERLESDNGINKYYIKADRAKTFSDNHQEFENFYLEAYDASGIGKNKLSAESAIYIPEEGKDFTAYLKGNVNIETVDNLKVRSNHIVYSRRNETAEADESVEFERSGVIGRSFGATLRMAERQLDLLRDVEIEAFDSPELVKSGVRYAKLNAGAATLDQNAGRLNLNDGVVINVRSISAVAGAARTTQFSGDRAVAAFDKAVGEHSQVTKLELYDRVKIVSTDAGQPATTIESGYASYDRPSDRFELRNGTRITTGSAARTTEIGSSDAVYERSAGKIQLTGAVQVSQGTELLSGDRLDASLFPDNSVKDAVIRGNARAKQATDERTVLISAPELSVAYGDPGSIRSANAIGSSTAEIIPADTSSYTRVSMRAAKGLGAAFRGVGLLDAVRTDGRTSIELNVPDKGSNSANKRLSADTVKTVFSRNGKDISRAEAVGQAELIVEPLNRGPAIYKTTINAPRFDCEFFPASNNARSCVGGKKARAVRMPTVAAEGRGDQVLTADILTAGFSESSKDLERIDAAGSAKFTELDRNAIASQISFTQDDGLVKLRGGGPTVWDSRARAKAGAIDWDTRRNRSFLRGSVSTTYYSRSSMKDSTPFATGNRPVFATSTQAEFDHLQETALYTGNARAWQDDNYVRGDRLAIDQRSGRLQVDGNVQSLLYTARIKRGGRDSNVPVSASAGSMSYERKERILRYRVGADVRQGTDRLTADAVDVYLSDSNEVVRTVAEVNVTITQPGRWAKGDWVEYVASSEQATIRGNPATVSDAKNGSTESGELTIYLRDNRVLSESKVKLNQAGRTRTVYKTKPNE